MLSAPVMLPVPACAGQREERECRKLLDMLCVREATTFDRQYARGEAIFGEYERG